MASSGRTVRGQTGLACVNAGLLGLALFAAVPAAYAAEPHGMVVTAQHLATDAGLQIERQGSNAVELIKMAGVDVAGANDRRRPAGSAGGY